MTDEKLIKCYKWLTIVGAILMIAVVVFFLFWDQETTKEEIKRSQEKQTKLIVRDSTFDWVGNTPYYHLPEFTEFEVEEGLRQRGDSDWNHACELAEKRILARGGKINPRKIKHYKH